MEYILNETKVKTSNGFKMNNIKVSLDLPTEYNFHDYIVNGSSDIKINDIDKDITSDIGLTFSKYKNVDIDINDNKDIILTYEFNNDNLIDNINIKLNSNTNSNIIIKYTSSINTTNFHHLVLNITGEQDSVSNITVINMLNNNSDSFIAINGDIKKNANIKLNILDMNGKIRINNINSNSLEKGKFYVNNLYIGLNNDLIDYNYYLKNTGKESINRLEVQGYLKDNAIKHFKGIIDFISGCSKSSGIENENVVLANDTVISRSLPVLLCGEEDVEGAHGVSSGKIDEEKLFYLMSRGLERLDAEKLIIKSNFNKIIKEINNEEIENEVSNYIDQII